MIKLSISGRNFEPDAKVLAYAREKIGLLDKYLPRRRRAAHGQLVLELDSNGREDRASDANGPEERARD